MIGRYQFMEAQVKWVGERMFLGETESGHTAVMDGPPEAGGRNMGIRPMEMILLGLGGCAAFDVVDILEKSRESVEDCLLRLEAERAFEDPKVFTRIELCFEVSGRALNPAKVPPKNSLQSVGAEHIQGHHVA